MMYLQVDCGTMRRIEHIQETMIHMLTAVRSDQEVIDGLCMIDARGTQIGCIGFDLSL